MGTRDGDRMTRVGLRRTSRAGSLRLVSGALLLSAVTLLAACQYPRDVEGTLDRVQGGTMRVGVIEDPPWVTLESRQPGGVEPELIRRFATELNAKIEWVEGSESELVEAMRGFQLDILVGGLTRGSPWQKHVALTRPYIDTNIEFAAPPGEEFPDDLEGVEIWVERYSEAAALLQQEEEETEAIYVDDVRQIKGLALLDSYDIDVIGYEGTDHILRDEEHAMAVPSGENAFLIELEHFLLDRGEEVEPLLLREARN
jgi:polar amino acid transport system substrate-binding protein